MTSPEPEGRGAARCMEMALKHAGLNREDVDYINAHGTSTGLGDVCETKAIKRVFGEHAKPGGLMVSSTKSMTGHTLGAAVRDRNGRLRAGDPGRVGAANDQSRQSRTRNATLDYVPHKTRERKIKVALNNSFGFGGHNATLIVREFAD